MIQGCAYLVVDSDRSLILELNRLRKENEQAVQLTWQGDRRKESS
jgi:hypothetical protein